jgi:hypothetical protein
MLRSLVSTFKTAEEAMRFCLHECPYKKPGCALDCPIRKAFRIPPFGAKYPRVV